MKPLALLPPLVALALQWTFWRLIDPYVWFLFYPAVFVSSWIGGLRSGLVATVLSTCLVWWFFVPPAHFVVKDPRQLFPAGVFLSMGLLFGLFHDRLRKANQQVAEALAASHAANREISHLYAKTKELDELKTQFFAGVSHELRTPLALILGPTQRMLDAPGIPEAARRDLEVIGRNARTLLRHVNDLLDVSKLEAARMKVEYVDTDLSRIAHFIASHFEVLAQEKRLTYTIAVPEGLRAQVDPDKVRRILLNLLSNAFKFTPSEGRVRLSMQEVAGKIAIEVADSGPGIPRDKREAVFERFRQLGGGATRRFGGTGLGLAITRDFVALHGGTLSVSEAPEGGALFLVDLPQQAPAGSEVREVATETAGVEEARQAVEELRGMPYAITVPTRATDGALVLVVEDNPEMNRFICECLASEHRVATAFDGKEGLRKALELTPDLILTDVMMPEMSGDELVHAIRSHRELDRTPIVLLTAKADDELRIRLLREGAQDCLTKPFLVDELRSRIHNLLAGKKAVEVETRLASLIEQAPDGIFVADLEGRYTEVNGAGCRMLGYSREEIIGKTIVDLIPPEDIERLWRDKAHFLKGGSRMSEWTLRCKDGTYLPVEVSAKILPDGRWQAFVRDISERKRAQDLIRQSQERFELALKGADLAAWDWNVKTGEVILNPRWAEMRGFRPEEIRPHVDSWIAGLHPDDRPHVQKVLADHFQGLIHEYKVEHRVLTKAGEWIWILDRGKVFAWDERGQPTRMVGTELDITDRKRAEEALRLSEAQAKFLAEAGAVLASTLDYEDTLTNIARLAVRDLADFCIVDIVEEDGEVRRLKVVSRDPCNARICDLLMQFPLDRKRPHSVWPALETKRPVLMQRLSPEMVVSLSQSEEHLRLLRAVDLKSLIAVPLLAHGKLLGVIAFVSSTPSRVYGPADLRLAEELAQRAALSIENARLYRASRRAIQARDDVLGIVAHDLRNPLNSIVMQAALLRRRGDEPERRTAEGIARAATRMNRLIEDLLDVTRMEAGRLSVEQTRVSTGQIVTDCVEAQKPLAASASLELRLDVPQDVPEVWADRDRLLQVFENLIGNAVKFTKPGGRIVVGAALREGEVLFWVTDTGVGIAPEDVPHLFDRFWQARKAEHRGAGLGLPIVKGIVEAHGGRIWVESTPGGGSTFFFTIPTVPPAGRRRPEPAPHSP